MLTYAFVGSISVITEGINVTVMQVVRTFIDICKIQGRGNNYLPRKLACGETPAMCEFGENSGTELAQVSLFAGYPKIGLLR